MQQYDAFAINRSEEIQNRRQFPMKMDLFGPIDGKRMVLVVICTMMIMIMEEKVTDKEKEDVRQPGRLLVANRYGSAIGLRTIVHRSRAVGAAAAVALACGI